MKLIAVIVLSLSAILALAQSGDAVFIVKKKAPTYLLQTFDTLFEASTYRFQIVGVEHKQIVEGAMKYGKVLIGDTDIVVIIDTLHTDTLKSILQLYILEGGKLQPVLAKQFTLLRKPQLMLGRTEGLGQARIYNPYPPAIYWLRDDTVSIKRLKDKRAYNENLLVWPPSDNARIISFDMHLICNDNAIGFTDATKVYKTTIETLETAQVGCYIRFSKIRCMRSDLSNDIVLLPDHTIRVTE